MKRIIGLFAAMLIFSLAAVAQRGSGGAGNGHVGTQRVGTYVHVEHFG